MLLQRLSEYADRLDLPPMLYRKLPVRYIIELDADGRPLSRQPTDTADPSNRATRRGEPMEAPSVQRSSGVRPLLLCDNATYALGLAREGHNPEREADCHRAFVEQLERCAQETREAAVGAVFRFLTEDPLGQLDVPEDLDRGANVTFRVDGHCPHDLPAVQEFWVRENAPGAEANVMQCLVCGRQRPALARLKGKIKGIPGGHSTGTALISANEQAYESYGLEASLIAPICGDCAERVTKGLNQLLRDDAHHLVVGNGVFVFWTREDTSIPFMEILMAPDPADVKALIASVYGRRSPPVETNRFHAATLSASGGRAVVRGWIELTLHQVQENLARWFQRQAIVQPYGEPSRPLGVRALAAATVRDLKDLPPPTMEALLASALLGRPLPASILHQVVLRTRAEQGVSHNQAALIKAVLATNQTAEQDTKEDDTMTELDAANTTPPYLCGRLLAVLESAQRSAIPGANTTIVDRYYGTASTAPATVFGSLLRESQAHLSKLRRDRPGAYQAIQREMEEILVGLSAFPRTLTFTEQALFALGYYHQRAHQRGRAIEARASRNATPGTE